VEPISDPFGPAAYDADLRAIVVSEETRKGGAAVNTERARRGLEALAVDVIQCVGGGTESEGDTAAAGFTGKLSSTTLRRWLAEGRFKER